MKDNSKKIKVIFGVNDFLVGGIQRQFIEQLRFFDRDIFDISIITLFEFSDKPNLFDKLLPGVSVYRLHFKNIRDVQGWKELYQLLTKINPDLVLSNLFFSNTVFRVLKPFFAYRVIACEHNTYTGKTTFQKVIDRMLALWTYRIVAVSNTVATFTAKQEKIRLGKFIVIPNGIDIETWQQRYRELPEKNLLRKELGISAEDKLVLTVARLMPQKNQRLLLEGFALFHAQYPDSLLAIVGDGPLLQELRDYAESLRISDRVTFFGMRSDVERFYKASDVFVLTSDIEGFGLVCVEAMAAGLPVVSTATAGPDEYIKDGVNGELVRVRTARGIADGLVKVIEGDMSHFHEGAMRTAEKYAIASSVKQYEQLFQAALES